MTTDVNYYTNAGNSVRKVGHHLTELMHVYRNYMDGPNVNKMPPYIQDVMGHYSMRSMFLRLPMDDAPESPVTFDRPPHHVARVIDATHAQLMGIFRNIRYKSAEPQATFELMMRRPEVREVVRKTFEESAADLRSMRDGSAKTPKVHYGQEKFLRALSELIIASSPPPVGKLQTLEFELEDPKTHEKVTVRVPNEIIHLKATDHIASSRSGMGVSLAAIAWGLQQAGTGKLLANEAGGFIQFFVGAQEGLTESMNALMRPINLALPKDKNIGDYLVRDGVALSKVVQEEAHHLQVMRAMVKIDAYDSRAVTALDNVMKPAGVDPEKLSLHTAHAARDVACILFSTAEALQRVGRKFKGATGHGMAEVIRRLSDRTGRSTSYDDTPKELLKLADEVGAAKNPSEMMLKLEDPKALALLNDAATRSQIIDDNIAQKNDGTGAPSHMDTSFGLHLVERDILPGKLKFPTGDVEVTPRRTEPPGKQ